MRVSFPRPALLLLAGGWTCPYRNHPDGTGVPVRESPFRGEGRDG